MFFACAKTGADPAAALVAARAGGARLPARRRGARRARRRGDGSSPRSAGHGLERLGARPELGPPATSAVARRRRPAALIYTSGTTGKPKGALLTHANCFWTNLSFDLATGISQHDVVLQVLPQFHVGGWNVQALLAWWKGATVVLERSSTPERALG